MKVITEAILREQLRSSRPGSYRVPVGKLLSPAAREYLQQCKISIEFEKVPGSGRKENSDSAKYVDYETGAGYEVKPEHMTQLHGNVLIPKDHKRIVFRGKLDSLQGLIVLNQAILVELKESERLIRDLGNLLQRLREIMRCDILDEPLPEGLLIGYNHGELRERSHYPMKYFHVKQMVLPDYTLGKAYALLNQIRTNVRETEVAATTAFHVGDKYEREDIIEEMNRMSSAVHILMCKYLAERQEDELEAGRCVFKEGGGVRDQNFFPGIGGT